jgi:hypothetical protein
MTPNKPVQPTPLRGAADLALWRGRFAPAPTGRRITIHCSRGAKRHTTSGSSRLQAKKPAASSPYAAYPPPVGP